jgi:hypothetical protein
MRNIEEYKTTTNRSVYNKLRKRYLEGRYINCSYCKYHKGENITHNFYGGFVGGKIKYPSWKLVTKNRKQWMDKKINKTYRKSLYSNNTFCEITFK